MYGTTSGYSSDCTGAGCDIEPLVFEEFEYSESAPVQTATWMDSDADVAAMPVVAQYAEPVEFIYETQIPVRNVKVLSIKPVPEDTRPKLWDGTHGQYVGHDGDKTVDWRDGVPIWDDAIVSYKAKDFSDWYLEPSPEIYLRQADAQDAAAIDPMEIYEQNMADAAATRARVEELLAPKKPVSNLWFEMTPRTEYVAQDMTTVVEEVFGEDRATDDGCPFETETECEIWRRKPIVRETVSPRSPKLRNASVNEFIHAADCNMHITANETVSAPLLDRYKMLMRSAQACCTDGMAYALRQAGASDGLVYKFLADDANFYGFGSRCLMMTDYDLDSRYPNTATAVVAADVRNGCLCRGRQWFQAMLAPFQQVYSALPEFKDAQFNYTYKDGLQREITVSVNNDVQNVLKQLAQCP